LRKINQKVYHNSCLRANENQRKESEITHCSEAANRE